MRSQRDLEMVAELHELIHALHNARLLGEGWQRNRNGVHSSLVQFRLGDTGEEGLEIDRVDVYGQVSKSVRVKGVNDVRVIVDPELPGGDECDRSAAECEVRPILADKENSPSYRYSSIVSMTPDAP